MLSPLLQSLKDASFELSGESSDYDPLLDFIGDAQFVLLGESTHGTHEFYEARAEITKQLIVKKGFMAVAFEADWPVMCGVDNYVRHLSAPPSSEEALEGFKRFPIWMWKNEEFSSFVEWLHAYNRRRGDSERIGFYGLDLYSLYDSVRAVIQYLSIVDPAASERARKHYECLFGTQEDPMQYGYAAALGFKESCTQSIISQLSDLVAMRHQYIKRDGIPAIDAQFSAEWNAKVIQNAEFYYRALVTGSHNSWNIRDAHMFQTLDSLFAHLSRTRDDQRLKVVVWAHNSHIGNSKATEMGKRGEFNLGEMARTKYRENAKLIGFTTSTGTVTAATAWGNALAEMKVQPPLKNSYEFLFSKLDMAGFILPLTSAAIRKALNEPLLERAIGVVYKPLTERMSHYFFSEICNQMDAVIHLDETRAVRQLAPQRLDLPAAVA